MPATRLPSTPAALRRALLLLLGVALALGALAAPASAAEDDQVTWGVRAVPGPGSTERQNYSYELVPGEQVEDAIVITNHGTEPLTLDLYAADGFTSASGQLDALPRAESSVALGTWVTPTTDQVEVPAAGSVEIAFTVTVPTDATPGDYAGAILTSLVHASAESGVDVDRRLGIRIHLRVAGELDPSLTVEDAHLTYAGTLDPTSTGQAEVTYTVRNDGNTRLAAAQQVVVAGPFGLGSIELHPDDLPELLPGESWTVSVPVDGVVPLLRLTARITLTPQQPDDLDTGTGLTTVQTTTSTWAVPWTWIALLLLLTGGTALLVRTARSRRARRERALVEAAVAQALREQDGSPTPVHADRPAAATGPAAAP